MNEIPTFGKAMSTLRSTYALVDAVQHRLKSTATLLSISENTLRSTLTESGIEVRRANQGNPNAPAVRIFDLPTIFEIAAWRRAVKQSKGSEGGKRPIYITVELIKGGTAKSTTACEVGVQLQLQGLKVLLIDLDIQANLTQLLGYEADLSFDEAESYGLAPEAIVDGTFATICAHQLNRSKPVDAKTVIKYPFGAFGPALIPADTFFGDLEQMIVNSKGSRELFFQRFFADSIAGKVPGMNAADFDVVIFDCPPSISFVSTNAIAIADILIAPVKMDSFSVKGLSRLVSEMKSLEEAYPGNFINPELVILPTYFSTNLPRVGRMNERLAQYRGKTAPTSISQSEEFPKSNEEYLPLTLTRPGIPAVKEYRMVVDFLIKKIQSIASKSKPAADQQQTLGLQ